MKILMLGRFHLMEAGGGDKVQILNTAEELRKKGVEVEIRTDLDFNPKDYDLVHVFQLDWTPETFFYVKKAFTAGKPVVLSPIHHSIKEVRRFDDEYVFDFRRISRILFKDQFHRDTFKNVYRSITDLQKLLPTIFSVFYGFKKMQKEVLKMSEVVLVQTILEAKDLEETFDLKLHSSIVHNGVSKNFYNQTEETSPMEIEDYILCVGRIEPRKNQLHVIEAIKRIREKLGKDLQLVFIGTISKFKHFEYNYRFHQELKNNKWIRHIEKVNYEKMPSYYKHAKVGVSASWFETTGLTSLEALFSGTNAVASGERAREYLNEYASYCDPGNIDSIASAIEKEYISPRPQISPQFLEEYTWEKAAEKTLDIYKEVINKWQNS